MKENKISIEIAKPLQNVFRFTINPLNTHKWVRSIVVEETNEYPPKLGTIYRNQGRDNKWNEYKVSEFEENKIFQLSALDNTYHVKYTYQAINENITAMEYYEWVTKGELTSPFTLDDLELLKLVMESN
ncbi:MAG: hypothetical protein WCJ58_06990 [bacterium]